MSNTTTPEMMKYVFTVDPAYGYVLLVLFFSYFLSFWQGFMVGRMRTKLKVDYPAMYSDTEPLFNCYQVINILIIINNKYPSFVSESTSEHSGENAALSDSHSCCWSVQC